MCSPEGNTAKMGLDATKLLGQEWKFKRLNIEGD
jgi:hypothetical protein